MLEDSSSLESREEDHDRLLAQLQNLPWSFIITRDARQTWANMDWPFRCELAAASWPAL